MAGGNFIFVFCLLMSFYLSSLILWVVSEGCRKRFRFKESPLSSIPVHFPREGYKKVRSVLEAERRRCCRPLRVELGMGQ